MSIKWHKVSALPASNLLQADSIYYVDKGTYAEEYVTSKDINGTITAKMISTRALTRSFATEVFNELLPTISVIKIVDTIVDRNLFGQPEPGVYNPNDSLVMVLDATGDTTVTSGSALYAWRASPKEWVKISEYESMDLSIAWDNIQGKPNVTASQVEGAVSNSHNHGNKTVLDKFGEDVGTGQPTYNGQPISSNFDWSSANW